jgi:hypothetical protein
MRFLGRAEPVLRERRRNVNWVTWFLERRLRAIALRTWTAVFEEESPFPFLGVEAAWGTDTSADSLLRDAVRMIRVDGYRLATIIDAYTSCAKALQIRRRVNDADCHILQRRQAHMRGELNLALAELGRVKAERTRVGSDRWRDKGGMDRDVGDYVDAVYELSSRTSRDLRY